MAYKTQFHQLGGGKACNIIAEPVELLRGKMIHKCWMLLLTILLTVLSTKASQVLLKEENGVKTAVYLSPKFVLGPGSVVDKIYHNIDFPKGHIGLKYFNAEVVDEVGNPVPLHQTYLHHWVLVRYAALTDDSGNKELKMFFLRNSGVCQNLGQYFGLGSETRRTDTHVPDPYAIEIGNPADVPQGYEERWMLNVHAIDTRGVVDRLGCTECRCDLYNTTINGYIGGLLCCPDKSQCRVGEGYQNIKHQNLYMRYTMKWVDWVDTIVPVRIYILDVTDTGVREGTSVSAVLFSVQPGCRVEYEIEPCGVSGSSSNLCLDRKKASIVMPKGGYVVYGAAHQHSGGIGATLYGEDGQKICSSNAIYGEGTEAGNEAGYIVGMTTCYPKPGSVKISDGETLLLESVYSSSQMHTGVMALFYLLVADHPANSTSLGTQVNEFMKFPKYSWALAFVGVAVAFIIGISYRRRNSIDEGYQSLVV